MKKGAFRILPAGTAFLAFLLIVPVSLSADESRYNGPSRWEIDDVITGGVTPFAIGHRGYGADDVAGPGNPTENTKNAVRRAFREGIMIVEVDANLTADKVAVALHDDYFFNEFPFDYTCVNQLTLDELREIAPEVSTLKQILQKSKVFSFMDDSDRPSGQVVVEIKTPSPICVPLEAEPEALDDLVTAVIGDIRSTRMVNQVVIESFSPEILVKAAEQEEDIPRMLALDIGQLLPLEMIPALTGYDVQIIDKDTFGLPWGEVGISLGPELFLGFYRWPGYFTVAPGGALGNYMWVMGEDVTGSSVASLDKNVLLLAPFPDPPDLNVATQIVGSLHSNGFSVLVFTIDFEYPYLDEWWFMYTAGVDGMFVDDIPTGITREGGP